MKASSKQSTARRATHAAATLFKRPNVPSLGLAAVDVDKAQLRVQAVDSEQGADRSLTNRLRQVLGMLDSAQQARLVTTLKAWKTAQSQPLFLIADVEVSSDQQDEAISDLVFRLMEADQQSQAGGWGAWLEQICSDASTARWVSYEQLQTGQIVWPPAQPVILPAREPRNTATTSMTEAIAVLEAAESEAQIAQQRLAKALENRIRALGRLRPKTTAEARQVATRINDVLAAYGLRIKLGHHPTGATLGFVFDAKSKSHSFVLWGPRPAGGRTAIRLGYDFSRLELIPAPLDGRRHKAPPAF